MKPRKFFTFCCTLVLVVFGTGFICPAQPEELLPTSAGESSNLNASDASQNAALGVPGPQGVQGPQGVPGPQGPQGVAGPPGTSIAPGAGLVLSNGVLSLDLTYTDGQFWRRGGNALGAGAIVLGATDAVPVELHSNNENVLRLSPDRSATFELAGAQSVELKYDPNTNSVMRLASGAFLTTNGVWFPVSDRARKREITPVDGRDVLARLECLPMSTWSYADDPNGIRHLGPMAQDFFELFGLGTDDRHLTTLDTSGVAMAAVKGLLDVVKSKDARLDAAHRRIRDLEKRLAEQSRRLDRLEASVAR